MTSGARAIAFDAIAPLANDERSETVETIVSHLHRANAVLTRVPSEALAHIRSAGALVATFLDEPDLTPARGGLAPWQAERVDAFIAAHIDCRITVDMLADVVGLSVGHFYRVFRSWFGVSPQTHVINRRVQEAKRLMLAGEERLAHISVACGFSDQSHFSHVFRRCTGQSPGAWRRTCKNPSAALVPA